MFYGTSMYWTASNRPAFESLFDTSSTVLFLHRNVPTTVRIGATYFLHYLYYHQPALPPPKISVEHTPPLSSSNSSVLNELQPVGRDILYIARLARWWSASALLIRSRPPFQEFTYPSGVVQSALYSSTSFWRCGL